MQNKRAGALIRPMQTLVALAMLSWGMRASAQVLALNPGTVSVVAGNGSGSFSPATYAGLATAVGLNYPRRVVLDASGNVFWIEKGGNVARVMASGNGPIASLPSVASPVAGWVYTVAGNGGASVCGSATDSVGDGCPATQASLNAPYALAVDAQGNVYLDDSSNYLVRVVYAGGTIPGLPASPVKGNVYAVAGTGKTGSGGGPALSAQIGASHGLAVDGSGNVYLTDSGNQSVRALYVAGSLPGISSPVVGNLYTLIGGSTGACSKATAACGDDGPATAAQINGPDSVSVDASGNVYFGDTGDVRLRAIYIAGSLPGITNPVAGSVYTIAGNGASGLGGDGIAATSSPLTSGMGQPAIDQAGNVYLPDGTSNVIRKIDPSGVIRTVAGGASQVCAEHTDAAGDGCPSNAMAFNAVSGVAVDRLGTLYIADYKNLLIRKLSPGATALRFSGQVGSPVAGQSLLLSNGGTVGLSIADFTFSGPFARAASGGDCLGSGTLASGASCTIAIEATASVAGDASGSLTIASNALNASSGQNVVTLASSISLGATTTALAVSPKTSNLGQTVTLSATVTPPAGAATAPSGYVSFLSGTTTLGTTALSGGAATFSTSSLAAGTYSLTAVYGGDSNYNGSTSAAESLVVSSQSVPTVTLEASSNPVQPGGSVTLTAAVKPFGSSPQPTGTVLVHEGAVMLGSGTLSAQGTVTVQVASLNAGRHTIIASYAGDSATAAADSDALTLQALTGSQLTIFPGEIGTVAGSRPLGAGYSGDGSAALSAQLKTPLGMTLDAGGNLYFADSGNNRIRRVDAATGVITTVAGSGKACSTAALPCGDGGQALAALLNGPQAVRFDRNGNLYIADRGTHAIRKIDTAGVITTVAGTVGTGGFSGDGAAATSATLNGPRGVFVDNGGNLYIGDSGNARVRYVDAQTGIIRTIAGSGATTGDGGAATAAQLSSPRGISLDSQGNLFIADTSGYRVRRVDARTGVITTVAGTGTVCSAAPCGEGEMATSAPLSGPLDVLVTAAGDVLFTDPGMNVVRRISPSGVLTTIAGAMSATPGTVDDALAATAGGLNYPNSLLADASGNLYVSEANAGLIRRIAAGGSVASFGDLSLGDTGQSVFTLANTGDTAFTLSGLDVPTPFQQAASGVADCGAQMAMHPADSCSLAMMFSPLAAGAQVGSAVVASGAANLPQGQALIALSGNGVAPTGTTAQSVSFPSLADVVYGTRSVALGATATSGLAVRYGSVTGPAILSGTTLTILGAGTVSVTAYQFGDATYAAATAVTLTFAVTKAPLTVTADNQSRAVGVANPTLTYSFSGLVNGDTAAVIQGAPAISTIADASSMPGSYPIVIGAGTLSAANYSFAFVNGTLTVAGEAQTIMFPALPDVAYGSAPVSLAAVSSSGLPVSYSISGPATLSGSVLTINGAGTVSVTATQSGDATYAAATPVMRSFAVTPAALTVRAEDVSRVVNTSNPSFTATISGYVHGEGSSVVSGAPAFSTTATTQSAIGTYPISVSRGTLQAANYSFTFVNGTLTVTQPPPDFTLSSNPGSLTLYRGTTGHLAITVTPSNGYKGSVAFSCGALPAGVTCAFTPATLTIDGSGAVVSGELDVSTSASMAVVRSRSGNADIALAGLGCMGGLLAAGALLHRRRRLLALAGLLLGTLSFTGCGAGSTYTAPVATKITVSASGSSSSGTTTGHTLSLNLTVI